MGNVRAVGPKGVALSDAPALGVVQVPGLVAWAWPVTVNYRNSPCVRKIEGGLVG